MGNNERYQTRECTIAQLQPELLNLASQYLQGNDSVLICFESTFEVFGGGLFGNSLSQANLGAHLCTSKRIISAQRGLWSGSYDKKWREHTSTVELSDVSSIQESQNGIYHHVNVWTQGEKPLRIDFFSLESSSKFATIVRNAVAQAKARNQVAASPNSVEERIRALKQLRQDGLITEAQFQQKIQEIVNQL